MLRALRIPIGWWDLVKRTAGEVVADNCLGLAAQLAYYFVLALFPALLFLVAVMSFFPVSDLMDTVLSTLGRVAPGDVLKIIQDQLIAIGNQDNGGLLTIGMLGTIWSTSAGMVAIIDTLNQAYDIQEGRPWWKVRLLAIGLTIALAVFIVMATALVIAGPILAERVAVWMHMGPVFTWTWKILQWPVVFVLVSLAIALVYYFAPDADQQWVWITPGSILATTLWLLASLGFSFYVTNFGSYNETYGTIGAVMVLMLWFYVSALAVLVGAEMNAEIEHASPYGKDPGEKQAGEKKKIGLLAEQAWKDRQRVAALKPAIAAGNCDVDRMLPPAVPPPPPREPRFSDWVLGGLAVAPAAAMAMLKVKKKTEA